MQNYSFFSDVLIGFLYICMSMCIESAKRKTMVEVKSKKPLLEAIQNGEQFIKITDPNSSWLVWSLKNVKTTNQMSRNF